VINIYKITIILFTVTIFFTSLVLPIKNAEAVSFTPSNMAVATKVIRGIGEKLGVDWSKGALDAVVGYIAGQAGTEGHEPILPFWWLFGTTPDTIPIDSDKSLVRLTPDDFRDGSKEIKKAIDAIVPDAIIPIYGKCGEVFPLKTGGFVNLSGKNYVLVSSSSLYTYSNLNTASVVNDPGDYSKILNMGSFSSYINDGSGWVSNGSGNYTPTINDTDTVYLNFDNHVCNYNVVAGDVVNISTVNNNMWNTTTNNYNYYNDYPVTIINEGTGTENVDVPVNPPFTPEETGNISDPAPPDTDNDGIPDSTDITPGGETPVPDDTGIFAKLFPVLLIVKLFGVLGSCLMYLVRMFQFIMTIPGIDAIPIDNDAFVWFRSAQIVGIKIYDVVSSLAGVGLSFIVFRAIRRAYL
jgi:hypothetical protein